MSNAGEPQPRGRRLFFEVHMDKQTRYLASVHECGHIVVARALEVATVRVDLADTPGRGWIGRTIFGPEADRLLPEETALIDLGGDVAVSEFRADGQYRIWQWCKANVPPDTTLAGPTDAERIEAAGIDPDVLAALEARAKLIVKANFPYVLAIATALTDCGRLGGGMIDAIIAHQTRTRAASGMPGFRTVERI